MGDVKIVRFKQKKKRWGKEHQKFQVEVKSIEELAKVMDYIQSDPKRELLIVLDKEEFEKDNKSEV